MRGINISGLGARRLDDDCLGAARVGSIGRERLAISIDGTPDESGVLTLTRRHRFSVYDAAYLELAVRNAPPLATLDAMLATAAHSEGVPLFGDDAG